MSKEERAHSAYQYGTDLEYLNWLTYQPSCLDGSWNQWDDGVGRNIACHVRRLKKGAGLAIKPPFSAVPMTDKQHRVQSGKDGELGAIKRFTYYYGFTQDLAKLWFEEKANEYLEQWIKERSLS